ncbi:hypothetical protein QQF64_005228 [Cirrhinus molitorella]|uniref:Uncharacterized protein n=1 Tax=Cirrhinus molitorella TaxID=172907 RepID=A0ABR3MKT5_9TELE
MSNKSLERKTHVSNRQLQRNICRRAQRLLHAMALFCPRRLPLDPSSSSSSSQATRHKRPELKPDGATDGTGKDTREPRFI